MTIVQLTPGAAGMHCGGCMRDNAIVTALRKLGHDALMVPLYTPLTTDETDTSSTKVFFGGLNVWLQQQAGIFRRTPKWLDNRFDSPALLNFISRFAGMTRPEELGEMTVSMLLGEDGRQAKELDKLIEFLKSGVKPEVVCLSNALLIGMARKLKAELSVPVVCTLQGEDSFVDGLPEPHRTKAWETLIARAAEIDAFIPVSRYYGEVMRERMKLEADRIKPVWNGIDVSGYTPSEREPEAPTIGFLSHMIPAKGLPILVDAFKLVREKIPNARLRVGGSLPPQSRAYVDKLQQDLKREGLAAAVDFQPNLSREEKVRFLQSLSVLSVPATYGEAFGLYLLEALACGVPVVQPRHGAFPEIIEATGGGVLCEPGSARDLSDKLIGLLQDPARRRSLGTGGRERVLAHFTVERAAREVADVFAWAKENQKGRNGQ
ncbi:MAG TPA: glycosyltransferase family 4 protein [Planctomycetota bacterium]|nr:glycosyltransferase family 4 protein [Planctomycetota bacterium]